MSVIEISDTQSGSRAAIAVESGFNCFRFVPRQGNQELNVIHAEDDFEEGNRPPSHNGIPVLFPFPNRIRSGKYSWDGQDYELPESLVGYDGSGNAIHGFCLDRPWRVEKQTESSVTGVFQISQDAADRASLWPADARLSVQYTVSETTLRSDFTVHNPDVKPLPWGLGTHAYFRLPLGGADAAQCTVFAPVIHSRQLSECLPTGKTVEIPADAALQESPLFSSLKLDDAFSGLHPSTNGSVETRLTDPDSGHQVIQRFSADFQELIAFTPPWTSAICLEPYTCATDAINLVNQGFDAGLRVLEPGDTWTGFIEIEAQF
ncbi:MAG: aldose 1-epimerase [Fuerstiella sp.]|nr:aldose 1-epimerase [Fuerstiella sp.]